MTRSWIAFSSLLSISSRGEDARRACIAAWNVRARRAVVIGSALALGAVLLFATVACGGGGGGGGGGAADGGSVSAQTIFVDGDATGSGAGTSWANAYTSLGGALADALAAATSVEVWVAEGTYYPTAGTDRFATFELFAGLSLYGGFDGTEGALTERDVEANPTVLSGEIGDAGDLTDNSYHVVTGASGAVIDGFTIEKGYAVAGTGEPPVGQASDILTIESGRENDELLRVLVGYRSTSGGGMINVQAAPTVRNCTFQDNDAIKGGAVYNMVLTEYPGGMAGAENAAATFENCAFQRNSATARGGAIENDFATSPTFTDALFEANHCDSKGGAVYSDARCDPTFVNCLFKDNTAERGAALASDGGSAPSLVWVTIIDNTANDVGASLYQGTYLNSPNVPHVRRSLVFGNQSGASPSSVSSWHDSQLDLDVLSVVETTDGDEDPTVYLADPTNDDFSPLAAYANLGWSPDRDTTDSATILSDATTPAEPSFPYDTSAESGAGGNTIYVDQSVASTGTGNTWPTAFKALTEALDVAEAGDQIFVADGTYYPTATATDREASFVLRRDVQVFGGFAGGEVAIGDRDITVTSSSIAFMWPTILSGDIDQDAMTDAGANSYHVVVGAKGATLNGCIVEDGSADGEFFHSRGGGLLAYEDASPTIQKCIFRDNRAVEGGGLMVYDNAADAPDTNGVCGEFDQLDYPALQDVWVLDNTAERGGGALFRVAVSANLLNVIFENNSAEDRGGGLYLDYGGCTEIEDCMFKGNASGGHGAGVYVDDNASQFPPTAPAFTDVWFLNNVSQRSGGGIYIYDGVALDLTVNSAEAWFSGNLAANTGGAIAVGVGGSLLHSAFADLGVTVGGTAGDNDVDVDANGTATEK